MIVFNDDYRVSFFGNKILDQCFGAKPKKPAFAKFCKKFLCFLALSTKNVENDYFDQHLACAAPKSSSKYTTSMIKKFPNDKYGTLPTHISLYFHLCQLCQFLIVIKNTCILETYLTSVLFEISI